jgi:calcineurin-like phosphoesterase family protein
MAVFVMGSPHFGQAKAIELFHRPFGSVEEMDTHIVDRINVVATRNDQLYILGNVFPHGTPRSMAAILNRIGP